MPGSTRDEAAFQFSGWERSRFRWYPGPHSSISFIRRPELTLLLPAAPVPPPGVEAAMGYRGGVHLKGGRLYRQARGPDGETFSVPVDFECMPRSESSTRDKINLPPPTKPLCPARLILAEKEGAMRFVSRVNEDKRLHLGANQTIN